MKLIRKFALEIILAQSVIASIGTLYYSQVEELPPCDLCWYQRGFMYGVAIVAALAVYFGDKTKAVYRYLLGLSVFGGVVAAYHYAVQNFIETDKPLGCSVNSVSCSEVQLEYLGFITIPLMSLVAFAIIAGLSIWRLRQKNKK